MSSSDKFLPEVHIGGVTIMQQTKTGKGRIVLNKVLSTWLLGNVVFLLISGTLLFGYILLFA